MPQTAKTVSNVNAGTLRLTGNRLRVAAFVEHPVFTKFIIWLILLNALTLGIEAENVLAATYQKSVHLVDTIVVAIFVAEILLKIYAYRFAFWRDGWNVFDFIIVAICLVPSGGTLSILRTLRVLRLLRLISVVPQMRRVVSALLHAMPGMGAVISVLLVIIYVAAVLATQLFGTYPDEHMHQLFGDLSNSMFTMFQLMTLEDWPNDVAKPTMQFFPWAWAFFVPFIVIASFAVLNLFIGIIVDALNIVQGKDVESEGEKIKREIRALRNDIATLHTMIEQKSSAVKKKK